jgi:AraC-like DNA-binding protein
VSGHQIIFTIDVVVVFCALLLVAGNVVRVPRNRNALLVGAILLGNACAVVLGRYDYGYWIPQPYRIDVGAWEPLLNLGRNMGPGLFMLLCHSLFQERRSFPGWLLALFALQLLLEEPVHLVMGAGAPWEHLVTEVAPGLLETVFGGLAVYWTVAGWKADLVETRRQLRWVVLIIVGLLMVGGGLLLRVVIPWNSIENYYAAVGLTALNAALLSAIVLSLLGRHSIEHYLNPANIPAPPGSPDRPQAAEQVDAAAVAELRRLMDEERVYRQPGLSLASLAAQMSMPEYRLRRLIHEHLGYRNFNVFVHDQRIREACEMLRDPEQSRKPILTIALSVGYQSINTFNRGFREVMGITPSAYRAGTPRADDGAPGAGAGSAPETGASSQAK